MSAVRVALASTARLVAFKHDRIRSEETVAYTAILMLDDQPVAKATNDGRGGADRIVALNPANTQTVETLLAVKAARVFPNDPNPTETLLGALVDHALLCADVNRKRGICFQLPEDGDVHETGMYRISSAPFESVFDRVAEAGGRIWNRATGDFEQVKV